MTDERKSNNLILLHEAYSLMEAHNIKNYLEVNGINAEIFNSHMSTIMPHLGTAVMPQVLVSKKNHAEALELLKELDQESSEQGEDQIEVKNLGPDYNVYAYRAAVLSMFIFPMIGNAYSFYLWSKAWQQRSVQRPFDRNKFILSVVFNVLGIVLGSLLISNIV